MSRATIQLTGDGFDGSYVTWEVHGRPGSVRVARLDLGRVRQVVQRLEEALPDLSPSDATWARLPPLPADWHGGETDPTIRRLHSAMAGPLRDPVAEADLLADLADALLPAGFRVDLLALGGRDELPLLRLAPSPVAAKVPWALLPVDRDRRLIEVCDLVLVAPLVEGDRGDDDPPWSAYRDEPCLHVIDPLVGDQRHVLTGLSAQPWRDHGLNNPGCDCQHAFTRIAFSEALHRPRSRLFFVGHVLTVPMSNGSVSRALALSDDSGVFSIDAAGRAFPPLTDIDLVRGLSRAEYAAAKRVPPAARTAEGIRATPGRRLWPMPPRVAIIACGSGPDLAASEPFGLVTAIVLNGARLVTATLWTLPTGSTYAAYGDPDRFDSLVVAAERIQTAADPIRALGEWQRQRLAAWRTTGSPGDSPLWWGGVVNFEASQVAPR